VARRADRVLVTRSEPGASTLVGALEHAGYAAFAHPVIEIRGLSRDDVTRAVAALPRWSFAIFVSAHAVEHGFAALRASIDSTSDRQWIAVGGTTARALAAHDIAAAHPIDARSEGILALPEIEHVTGRSIVIVAGRAGREYLADSLRLRGNTVSVLHVYERIPVANPPAARDVATVGTVVLSSTDGAIAFERLWRFVGGARDVCIVVPSERVATAVRGLGLDNVIVSDGASDTAVLAALRGRNAHE
jgi:uroporphyrinogen-III synthase